MCQQNERQINAKLYFYSSALHIVKAQHSKKSIGNALVLCYLYTGLFKFERYHYFSNVARVKSSYRGWLIVCINLSHDIDVPVTWYWYIFPEYLGHI